jgi:hypothetical protein
MAKASWTTSAAARLKQIALAGGVAALPEAAGSTTGRLKRETRGQGNLQIRTAKLHS